MRIVYYCFVEQFDYSDPGIVIICKDGDNFNIRPSNLQKVSLCQKQQRTVQRKRFRIPYSMLSEKQKKKQRAAIIKSASKQVTQYTKEVKKIKTYSSMAAAERATAVFASSIGSRAAGKGKTAGGIIWKWGQAKE